MLAHIDARRILRPDWPDDLPEIVYIDPYGNAITGMRATKVDKRSALKVGSVVLHFAREFSELAQGAGFWHANSSGLIEIAVNQDNAARSLNLKPDTKFNIV